MTEITDLPVEILNKILNCLDYESMKNACLVCKDWEEIISSLIKFTRSTKIVFKVDNKFLTTNKTLKLTRISDSVVFDGQLDVCCRVLQEEEVNQMQKFISGFSDMVKYLTIQKFTVKFNQSFNQITEVCQNLKKLKFSGVMTKRRDHRDELEPEMITIERIDKLILDNSRLLLEQIKVKHVDFFFIMNPTSSHHHYLDDFSVQCLNEVESLNTLILLRCVFNLENILIRNFNGII